MPVERRKRVIAIGVGSTGNGRNPTINGRRQPSCGDTSRMNREVHVRFCEGLGVEFPGPTRPLLPSPAASHHGSCLKPNCHSRLSQAPAARLTPLLDQRTIGSDHRQVHLVLNIV